MCARAHSEIHATTYNKCIGRGHRFLDTPFLRQDVVPVVIKELLDHAHIGATDCVYATLGNHMCRPA